MPQKIDLTNKNNKEFPESNRTSVNEYNPQDPVDHLPLLSDSSDKDTKVSNRKNAKSSNHEPIQKGAASPHNRKHKQPKSTEKIPDKNQANFLRKILPKTY